MTMSLLGIKTYGNPQDPPIVLLGGWAMTQWQQMPLALNLVSKGYFCVSYIYNKEVLSPDISQTLRNIHTITNHVHNTVSDLYTQRGDQVHVFGTSLGALLAVLAACDNPSTGKLILNVPAFNIAEAIWGWDHVIPIFKDVLIKKFYTLAHLKKQLAPIEPLNYIKKLKNKPMLIFTSTKDTITPCDVEFLKNKLEKYNIDYKLIVHRRMGHVLAGFHNMLNASVYLDFLKGGSTTMGVLTKS
jgi:esterase/lipase